MPDLVPPGRGEAGSAAAASLGGWIRRGDKAAATAGDKPNAGGATPHPEVTKALWVRKNEKMRR
uniref:Uncharacterized protein n=1 Tax=Oryza barthii TaxID=65489 RepID=A0A0D3H548_9ORYZ